MPCWYRAASCHSLLVVKVRVEDSALEVPAVAMLTRDGMSCPSHRRMVVMVVLESRKAHLMQVCCPACCRWCYM